MTNGGDLSIDHAHSFPYTVEGSGVVTPPELSLNQVLHSYCPKINGPTQNEICSLVLSPIVDFSVLPSAMYHQLPAWTNISFRTIQLHRGATIYRDVLPGDTPAQRQRPDLIRAIFHRSQSLQLGVVDRSITLRFRKLQSPFCE